MLSTFNEDPDMTMTALPEAPGDELHHAGGHRVMAVDLAPAYFLDAGQPGRP